MIINGKDFIPRALDFNATVEMERLGGSIYELAERPLAVKRAYLAYCKGISAEAAGAEIEAHVIGGGTLSELDSALTKAVEESGFFKALLAKAEGQTKK